MAGYRRPRLSGQLIVIDTATHQEVKRVKVGGFAIGVEITPAGRRAFVGCEHADGVHVIDMARLTVEKVIKTGNGPDPMAWWVNSKGTGHLFSALSEGARVVESRRELRVSVTRS